MANAKFVKTAAAVALGASVVTTAVAPGAASAATKYKVNSKGNLVLKSTGSLVKGWVEFGGKLYKNGKPAPAKKYKIMGTGASMKLYFGPTLKKGYKTANSKSLLFKDGKLLKGNKQTADRTRYYENGKLATGWDVVAADETKYIYKSGKLFKEPKTATRDGVLNYFENGKLAEGTKAFKDTLFTDGTVDEKDQVFEDVLYVGGKKAEGTVTFEDLVYIDGVKDTEKPEITAEDKTVEYGSEAVDVATLATVKDNSGEEIKAEAKISFDGKAVEKIDTKTPGVYTVTFTAKDKNGNEAEAKEVKVTVAEAAKAEVESVTAINATQVEVKFSKAVDKDSVINATDKKVKNVAFKSLDGKVITSSDATGELSKDGKKLTITAKANETFEGRYDVTIDKVKDIDGKDLPKYEAKNLDFGKDTTAPALVGTEKVNSTKVKVNFSEPLASEGKWTFTDANGKAVETTKTLSLDGLSVEVTITDANLKAGSEVTATILGAKDKADNVINPNPSTVKFVKGDKDGVAPVVSSVTAKGLDTFELKFSEAIQTLAVGSISIDGTPLTDGTITPDDNDNTKYTVKLTNVLTPGLHKVEVKSAAGTEVADLSGEPLTAFTQLVDFKADTVKPAFVSSSVVVNADTKKEQLVLNFDKEVTDTNLTNVVATKLDKDLVTTKGELTAGTLAVNPKNKKQLVVDLDTVKFTPNSGTEEALTKDATYTLNFADGAVNDTNTVANTSKAFEVKFKRGEDGTAVSTDKPVVTGVTATDSNTVTVTFDKAVDGVSATNVANYSIPGLTIDKAVLNPVSSSTQTVTLTLKKGTNTLDGDRVLTISNVKAKNGEVMDTVSKTVVNMPENVVPTVTKAQFTNTTDGNVSEITVTFSEAVTVEAAAFEVYVGDATTPVTTTTAAVTTAAKEAKIAITNGLTTADLAKGITVKLASGKVIKDGNNNALDFTSIKAAQ